MDKLYVLDAVNILFRSYYAIGRMTNPQGLSTNALYGFIRSVYKLIKEVSADCLVAVFDGPDNKQSRTSLYADYKKHRKGMPEDLVMQLEWAHRFCALAGIPYLEVPGVEADDAMGSVAVWAANKGAQVFLCTSDKDLCQLVSDRISVMELHKEGKILDRKGVHERLGVYPEQVVDFLAIMGDASDHIPGIKGFGEKTAMALLEKGSLDELFEDPSKIPNEKKRATFIAEKESALLSRQLARIHTDVDVPKESAFFHLKEPDRVALQKFYQEMHFLSLLKEMEPPKEVRGTAHYHLVDDKGSLEQLIKTLIVHKEICIDTETTDLRPMYAQLVGVAFSVCPGEAWYVPANGKLGKAAVVEALGQLCSHPDISFCGHHIKYDMHVLLNEGVLMPKIGFDTMLASYLLQPHVTGHSLESLSLEKLGKVKTPIETLIGKGKAQKNMQDVPIEDVCAYCCQDVDYTCQLKELFKPEIEKAQLTYVLQDIELPLVPVLIGMERAGIYVDVAHLEGLKVVCRKELVHLEQKIYKEAGEEFTINSPKQLGHILFEKLGIKSIKKTATGGYSTSADVLEELKEGAPIVEHVLHYRMLDKLRTTYIESLPDDIFPGTGRIHCTFNQFVTATGRLSCQDPNLQNIPVRSSFGRSIREAFRPQKPDCRFVSADYSQIELRLLAHLSEDPALVRAFKENEDVHVYTASLVFGVPLQEVSPEMRHKAKAVNFGILYGQQAYGLSKGLGISVKEAAHFIETYFARYTKVRDFFEFCKESVRKQGKAVTLTGRQRPIPEIDSVNPVLRAAAERLAINTPLQGTAADLIKLAMIELDKWLAHHKDHGQLLLQIHDELLCEVPKDQVDTCASAMKRIMEGVLSLRVPLHVEVAIGKNWGEC